MITGFRAACVRFICDSDTRTIWTLTRSSQNRKSAAFWLRISSAGSSRCSPGSFRSSTKLHTERIRKGFAELAEKATAEELTKAAALSTALAQVNAAVDMYELTAKQLKLAATTSITIKTEVTDHE